MLPAYGQSDTQAQPAFAPMANGFIPLCGYEISDKKEGACAPSFLSEILLKHQCMLQGMDKLCTVKWLENESLRSDFNRFVDCIVIGKRRNHNNPRVRPVADDGARSGQAVHTGHNDIHGHKIGLVLTVKSNCFLTAAAASDDFEVGISEQLFHFSVDDTGIIHNHNAFSQG